jgi:23S rRNA (cytidine1920-2'-O)/16S rRNA (cytidine1409-2'-O)-methyltransferase
MSKSGSKTGKIRIDQLLVKRGLAESRNRAQALIMAGKVVVDDTRIDKAGQLVAEDSLVRLKGPDHPYVSRAGVKLAGALDVFSLDVTDFIVLDVGASTGGFTDCLLQRGAKKVYALDVGRGQLHNKLVQDPRVVVMDGVNVRYLEPDALEEKVDLAVFDLSFISLKLVLPPVILHVKKGGRMILMVKPQFEVGKDKVGKGGIVRDPDLRKQAADQIAEFAREQGLKLLDRVESSLAGADGNLEIFLLLELRL